MPLLDSATSQEVGKAAELKVHFLNGPRKACALVASLTQDGLWRACRAPPHQLAGLHARHPSSGLLPSGKERHGGSREAEEKSFFSD